MEKFNGMELNDTRMIKAKLIQDPKKNLKLVLFLNGRTMKKFVLDATTFKRPTNIFDEVEIRRTD